MSINQNLKELWASNKGDGVEVNTLEFRHPSFASFSGIYRITDYHKQHTARLESGGFGYFNPIPMEVSIPELNGSTEQKLTVNLDALEGTFYSLIKDFTATDKASPIEVSHRIYVDTNFGELGVSPASEYVVTKATIRTEVLTIEMSSVGLPQKLAGRYYTKNIFRGLIT